MDFILGCNYWASNAGTRMWKDWDPKVIERDLEILSSHSIEYLRVFPTWDDFQPVIPIIGGGGEIIEYALENEEEIENEYYLSETALGRFQEFCRICEKYNIKLIVGLITGWMSGRIFTPPALYSKNLFSDPAALMFEQLFIRGFVGRFLEEKQIYAWDHGNECNCLGNVGSEEEATSWTAAISNAIKAIDPAHPLISGIHDLSVTRDYKWTVKSQALYTDVLATHPYPFWSEYAKFDDITSLGTILYPQALTKFYSEIGKRPCIVEEIGTMGNSVCSDEYSNKFLRAVLFGAFENNFPGVMWWCANDQTELNTMPFTWNMCERELGLIDVNHAPKSMLGVMKDFSRFVKSLDFTLPPIQKDALFISSFGQDQRGVGFSGYVLARQAGFNIEFAYCDDELPDYHTYMLPSYSGVNVMHKKSYLRLKEKVKQGADLYISFDGGIISEFEELTGVRIECTKKGDFHNSITINSQIIEFTQSTELLLKPITADVLVFSANGSPIITKNKYGMGNVYFVAFPIEAMTVKKQNSFNQSLCEVYKYIFDDIICSKPVYSDNKQLLFSYHYDNNLLYCVATNLSSAPQELCLKINDEYKLCQLYNAEDNKCKPYEAVIIKLEKLV